MAFRRLRNREGAVYFCCYSLSCIHPEHISSRNRFSGTIFYRPPYLRILTGDGQRTALAVSSRLGIERFVADALPDDKAEFIRELQLQGKKVAMVGDGINDSQALALADVSIAMGKGTDIAMDVAMVTLMTSDLLLLPKAFQLSKQTVKLIHQNLFWAFIYNLIGIPIAAGVLFPLNGLLLNPMLASAAMAFSSVSVVLNSLSLGRRSL